MAKSTPDQLSMFTLTTSEGSPDVTSSPASAHGTSHSTLPDGLKHEKSGRDPVPANRSAWRAKAKAPTIRATFGLNGFGSSESAALTRSLENRLRANLDGIGSTLFRSRWKVMTTPSHRSVCLLQALAPRKAGRVTTSWPTTTARDGKSSRRHGYMPTANAGTTLYDAALSAHWAAPCAGDSRRGSSDVHRERQLERGNGFCELTTQASWATPNARDHKDAASTANDGRHSDLPRDAASAVPWATPAARDYKDSPGMATTGTNPDGSERSRLDQLPRQAQLAVSGETANGSNVGNRMAAGKLGRLDPVHSRWLMGFPAVWDMCAIVSWLRSRKKS